MTWCQANTLRGGARLVFCMERKLGGEREDRQPFVIRAHHIFSLLPLSDSSPNTPEEITNRFIERTERKRRASEKLGKEVSYAWYGNDVLGSTQEETDKYSTFSTEFFREFLQLADDDPVKIVIDQKDKMCQGCAIGQHCRQNVRTLFNQSNDDVTLGNFIKVARLYFGKEDFSVVSETATYSNSKPRRVKSVITTARVVRKVVSRFHLR